MSENTVAGSEDAVWTKLSEAKTLYEAYLNVNATADISALCSSVTSEIQLKEPPPPLTLAFYS